MELQRASGILLHPTSLPSRYGIGDLGHDAYRFVDFLAGSGQQMWQVLPLGPTGYGNSPYLSYSALAGNPFLISPDLLRERGLLTDEDLSQIPEFPRERVYYEVAAQYKLPLLRQAFDRFKADPGRHGGYHEFCDRHHYWVDDYALFMSLKDAFEGKSWNEWDKDIAKREPEAIHRWQVQLGEEMYFHKYLQYEFFRQWKTLKQYANDRRIRILGDVPIYVAHDSMAVWANQEIFHLDEQTGEPALMAGVPPDYFSATGQLWGNPVYKWEQIERNGFEWWLRRMEGTLDYVDVIRIDHFRGFEAFWAVNKGEPDARNGRWMGAPGDAFFRIMDEKLGKLPIVAEDLGIITPEVEAMRDRYNFPGMKILQFAFDSGWGNPYLPYNYYDRNCIVYTGTHDNDTTLGWFENRSQEEKDRVTHYLGCVDSNGIHWSLIRLAMGSVGNQVIFPLQDILGLGSDCRMNTPGNAENNWAWRYSSEQLTDELRDRLRDLTYLYGRGPT